MGLTLWIRIVIVGIVGRGFRALMFEMPRLVTAAWLFVGLMYGQIANAVKLEAGATATLKGDGQNAVYTVSAAAGQTLLVEIDSDDKPYRNQNRV